ncbi:porphobilinogen deaminase [Nematostella vectensis]|uniref:porphobilinogen deaminase n=1 Tax=Nematostella vectensis TaxID=45351 RepID=UPI00138FECF5|nr:porphobilinogen deaminase [Nematostella vectensis]
MSSSSESPRVIKVGTRDSQLAMIQTNFIVCKLKKLQPELSVELVSMKTIGDEVLDKALPKIGETNLFTKELELALAAGKVDFLVHSLKDLPSLLPEGMGLAAIYCRDDPRDAVIFHAKHKGASLASLPEGSNIGTSSLRRVAQLKRNFPHLKFESIRGNLNTRLRKLDEGDKYDAIVLAKAGLDRMGWEERTDQVLTPKECLYAVGQGALAVELNVSDLKTFELISQLFDFNTTVRCATERSFLRTLEGGCSVPVGVHTELIGDQLTLTGAVLSLDGSECIQETMTKDIPPMSDKGSGQPSMGVTSILVPAHMWPAVHAGEELGHALAQSLIKQGANSILAAARQGTAN